jgi:N-acetylneuraminic acid mutarotase
MPATTKDKPPGRGSTPVRAALLVLAAILLAGCAAPAPAPREEGTPDGRVALPALSWTEHAPAPLAIAEMAVAQEGAEAWLVGGFTEAGGGSPTVLVHDMGNDSWRQGPPYPLAVHHAQAAFVDGTLYVFGGYVTGALLPGTLVPGAGPSGWPRTSLAFRLERGASAWTPAPTLPAPRAAGGAAILDGKVYLVGGVGMDGFLATTHVFDPAAGAYAEAAPLPVPRDHLTVMALGGMVYALAGREDSRGAWDDLETSEVYDPASDAWSALPPAPLGRGGQTGAPWRGLLPLFGGERAEGAFTVYDDAHAYDPARGAWVELPRLPAPRHGMGSAAWGERVYLLGGATPTALLASVVSLGPAARGA